MTGEATRLDKRVRVRYRVAMIILIQTRQLRALRLLLANDISS